MPEGQFDILLEEKNKLLKLLHVSFYFLSLKFYTVRVQERGLEKESCGTVILCCGKGIKQVASIRSLLYYSMLGEKTSLMVTLTQHLEKS